MIKNTNSCVLLLFVTLFSCSAVFAQPGFGQAEKINTNWRFHLGDLDGKAAIDSENKSWQNVELPHDWSVKQVFSPTYASASGYLPGGIGWYSKQLNIAREDKGKKIYLYFEGVYNRSEVFVNGQSVGKRPNGYISFSYEISSLLRYGQQNQITVRVDHSLDADSRWYTGSGIYRDVWLVKASAVHLQQWGLYAYPVVSGNKGILHVNAELVNDSPKSAQVVILQELLDQSGAVVSRKTLKSTLPSAGKSEVKCELEINNPKLWNTTSPDCYTLRTTVTQNNRLIDQNTLVTGFRTFTFDPDKGFALNGVPMKVKGVCLHHDSGVLGAEVYPEVWRRRLLTLKSLGVNAIRTSHNPQASSLYDLCDELGMLVMDEAFDEWEYPKRKWLQGWNVGVPGFQGTSDFFREWGERDLADMVKRDRNHLSIFAWSIGNEVDYPNDPYSHPILAGAREGGFTQPIFGGYKKDAPDAMHLGDIAKMLAAVVRKYDASRPVTAGLAGVAMSNETAYSAALDIAGYNYTESRYDQDHKRYPKRIIFGSENRHDFDAWKSVKDNEHIFGQFLWTGIDYLGESGRWPSRGFYSGLLDFAGFIKPRGYFRQSLWSDKPMAYLGTYSLNEGGNAKDAWSVLESEQKLNKSQVPSMDAWPIWNYQDGQLIRVVCYTNARQMRLELNGKVVGENKKYDQKHGITYWDIPFAPGKLEIVGMDAGNNIIVRQQLQTSKRPTGIKVLQGDKLQVKAKKGIAQLELQIVDEEGIPVLISDEEITCDITGPARLLGMEAGDNADMGDYTDHKQRVYHGKLIVYIQANGKPAQEVLVRFTSPWLKSAELRLELL
ncbi:sugar-binding domain-containing protein [Pedobacter rhizosphaerae]|uniref:Beta-galactosidase/beta-glucuronidase n=1 Tax=Pedobacter rhizosphaerae TaxID=390241 RepID=A0A1H9R0T1_9SPHI|nr:sugar-binding domain-containing protein [Pedobacter rhizosphaerae]SER66346.1 Beta-galactosidase/beta-glucuronidase [Pedobacter rhizosphaerae]